MTSDDLHKGSLLAYLCGDVCPGCGAPKERYQWTCHDCFRPNRESPEHRKLSDICDEHMRVAATFIGLVRATNQKPESD